MRYPIPPAWQGLRGISFPLGCGPTSFELATCMALVELLIRHADDVIVLLARQIARFELLRCSRLCIGRVRTVRHWVFALGWNAELRLRQAVAAIAG